MLSARRIVILAARIQTGRAAGAAAHAQEAGARTASLITHWESRARLGPSRRGVACAVDQLFHAVPVDDGEALVGAGRSG
jgi:hypothetical protein